MKKVLKCDQISLLKLVPVNEATSNKNQIDIERTSDKTLLKVRSLTDVYERCNLVHAELTSYNEPEKKSEWVKAMKVEMIPLKGIKLGNWYIYLKVRRQLALSGLSKPNLIYMA